MSEYMGRRLRPRELLSTLLGSLRQINLRLWHKAVHCEIWDKYGGTLYRYSIVKILLVLLRCTGQRLNADMWLVNQLNALSMAESYDVTGRKVTPFTAMTLSRVEAMLWANPLGGECWHSGVQALIFKV